MPPSINLEYVFGRMFQLLTQIPFDPHSFSGSFVFFIESLATAGMVVAVVLLVMAMYVRLRLIQIEHYGFLAKEEEERARRHQEAQAAKNPRWEMVVALASSTNESEWRRAILEADSMLAALLAERGYQGESLGEQLKGANPLQFTTLDLAWEAHRMRNAVAHLGEAFPLSERDMRATIDQYRRVFEEFSYI